MGEMFGRIILSKVDDLIEIFLLKRVLVVGGKKLYWILKWVLCYVNGLVNLF